MSVAKQVLAVTVFNLRSVPQRLAASVVVAMGTAGVVAVLLSVLAMADGLIDTVATAGRDDRAIVLRAGAESEGSSTVSRDVALIVASAAGVKQTPAGEPIASPEFIAVVSLPRENEGSFAELTLRGVTGMAFNARPEMRLVEGRSIRPGLNELMVGRGAQRQFQGLAIGDRIAIRGAQWTVIGVFESQGDVHESELVGDADALMSAYAQNYYQSVTVLLDSASSFASFKAALTSTPGVSVDVRRERDYYGQQSKQFGRMLLFVAYIVGGIMAVGAIFAALNTMYSAVSARSREIATLRAMGFGAGGVALSILVEALLLAAIGAALGIALCLLLFHGKTLSTVGDAGQVVFQSRLTLHLMAIGVVWALGIGLVGGMFPAIRAARAPVAVALRAI